MFPCEHCLEIMKTIKMSYLNLVTICEYLCVVFFLVCVFWENDRPPVFTLEYGEKLSYYLKFIHYFCLEPFHQDYLTCLHFLTPHFDSFFFFHATSNFWGWILCGKDAWRARIWGDVAWETHCRQNTENILLHGTIPTVFLKIFRSSLT